MPSWEKLWQKRSGKYCRQKVTSLKRVDFEHGSIGGNILQTALPMLVAQLINLLYNIVDRIYIGRIPGTGTEALGAVGLCFPFVMLIAAFTNMFGLGGAPLFSIQMGKQKRKNAGAVLNSAFRLELISGLLLFVFCEIFAEVILRLFGASENELIFALPYIRIYLMGTVFSSIATGMNPYINSQGYAMIGMVTVLIGAVANIVLDPVFIFALGLGVSGAAIATVLSQGLSMLFVLSFLFGKNNDHPILYVKRIDTEEGNSAFLPFAREIMALGLSPFIMQFTNALTIIACNKMLLYVGGAMYVSAMTIISSVRQILDTPVIAITEGSSPTISYNYGAARPNRVRRAMLLMAGMAIGYTCLMWLFIEWKPELLIAIFTEDTGLMELAKRPLHLYFYAFIFQSLQYSGQTVFKALNKKNHAVFFSIFRKVILVVPLTILLPTVFSFGTDGVFLAEPVSNVVGGLACMITMLLTVLPELKRMEK